MLHLRLRVPHDLTDEVVDLLVPRRHGDRSGADPVVAALPGLELHHVGSIMLTEPSTLVSDPAERVAEAAPGIPDDAIAWDVVGNRVRSDSVLSVAFVALSTLARPRLAALAGTLTLLGRRWVWSRMEGAPRRVRLRA